MSTKQTEKREPKGTPEWHLNEKMKCLEEEIRFLREEVEFLRDSLYDSKYHTKTKTPLIVLK